MHQPLLLATLLCFVGGACTSERPWQPDAPTLPEAPQLTASVTIHTGIGASTVTGQVRATDAERSLGLMHRKAPLGNETGMLFVMDDNRDHSFWMKNTYIPLDMVFIDHEYMVVGLLRDVEPLTLTGRSVGKASRYVLELDAGWCHRHGVSIGNRVNLSLLPST